MTHDCKRHGITTLFASFNVLEICSAIVISNFPALPKCDRG
jgi:hypothetical protein